MTSFSLPRWRHWLACIVIGLQGLGLTQAPPARAQEAPDAKAFAEATWREFRRGHGLHSQLLGLSAPDAAGRRVLLIAEPAERWTEPLLRALVGSDALAMYSARHRVMHGGEVMDALVVLRPGMEAAELQALSERLHRALFGTARAAQFVSLPAAPAVVLGATLDLSVSADDLQRHLVAANPALESGTLQGSTTVSSLLQARGRGVYSTRGAPGFVVWALPRGGDISGLADQVRQFALAGDLLLGAVADANTVLVVARRRQESQRRLPPLRNDTVQLLAGIGARQISQSYERQMWMSGRDSEQFDRAPIHLSDELRHTEYGSLLNIVDQLLKGWSEQNKVIYRDFDYPRPAGYPFGEKRASETEPWGETGFLFNWNTDGMFYVNRYEGFEIAALHRTGALPVIYGSMEARRLTSEAIGHQYFANTGDANIARVVQYAALYAVFKRYEIRSDWLAGSAPANGVRPILVAASRGALDILLKWRQDTSRWAATRQQMAQDSNPVYLASFERVQAALDRLLALDAEAREQALNQCAQLLGDPRGAGLALARQRAEIERLPAATAAQQERARALRTAQDDATALARWLSASGYGAQMADGLQLWQRVERANDAARRGWIKTAAVVASRDTLRREVVGGHSIDAAMTQLRADASVLPGQVRAVRDGSGQSVVLYNPADRGRAAVLSRTIADFPPNTTVAQAEARLAQALARTPVAERSLPQMLGRPGPAGADYERLAVATEQRLRDAGGAARVPNSLARAHRPTIVVRRLDDHYEVISTETNDMLRLGSSAALQQVLVDHVRGGSLLAGQARIVMEGFPADKVQAMVHSVRHQVARGNTAANDGLFIVHPSGGADAAAAFAGYRPRWSAVRVLDTEASWRPITEGRWAGHTEVSLRLNLAEATRPPLLVRLVFYVKRLITDSAQRQALLHAVAEALHGFGQDLSLAAMPHRFKAALKQAGLDADDVELRLEAADVFVADAAGPSSPPAADAPPRRRLSAIG
ncbi:MAG: hypothetical protein HY855_05855 [Burkholderiales bacterium]|nr:hypothetical protein [Burkholderiales bacterium]